MHGGKDLKEVVNQGCLGRTQKIGHGGATARVSTVSKVNTRNPYGSPPAMHKFLAPPLKWPRCIMNMYMCPHPL